MSTAEAEGALSHLIASGIDIVEAANEEDGAEFDVYVGYDGDLQRVFSGLVDTCDINFDDDRFEIRARDFSSLLADGKQTVAKLKYKNQSVAQIVQQIADEFEFDAEITDPGTMAGPEMNGEHSFNPHPQSYWSLLQSLAETVGYECYMKPDQTLYFGPGEKQNTMTVSYGASRESGAENPGWGLTVQYDPRNNSNITVKSLSLEPQKAKTVTAKAEAKPLNLSKMGRKSQSSLRSRATRQVSSRRTKMKSKKKTTYFIRCAGMTPEQAEKRCQAMADNLAKHQVIIGCSIEGNTDMVIHTEVKLKEETINLYGFAGIPLNVSEVTHEFSVPDDGGESGGFTTSFRAMAKVGDQ